MPNSTLPDVDAALLYIEDVPAEYFDDFRKLADDGLTILEEPRENVPYSAIEWVVPTAIAVCIGMKFIDAFIKRAVDDVADATYPKFKAALADLVKKIFLRDRGAFSVISSAPNKVSSPQALIFSVYSETRIKKRVKFVFNQELSEIEYEECVEQIFATLRAHHVADGDQDRISRGIADVSDLRSGEVYMVYDAVTSRWEIIDPIAQIVKRQARNEDAK